MRKTPGNGSTMAPPLLSQTNNQRTPVPGEVSSLFVAILAYSLLIHCNVAAVAYAVALATVAALIVRPRFGVLFLMCTIILSPDRIVTEVSGGRIIIENSLFLNTLGGFTLSTFVVAACAVIAMALTFAQRIRVTSWSTLSLLFLPLVVPLHGCVHAEDIRAFVSDSRYLLAPATTYALLLLSRTSPYEVIRVFNLALLAKCITVIAITFWFSGLTLVFWGFAVYLAPTLVFLNARRSTRFQLAAVFCAACPVLFFPGRGRVLILLFCAAASFLLGSWRHRAVLGFWLALVLLLVPCLLERDALVARHLLYKMSTVNLLDEGNQSAHVRLVEFMNIMHGAVSRVYPVLVGEGYGGYFTDDYNPFNSQDLLASGAAFKEEQILDGKFYDTHTNLNFMLLKAGPLWTLVFFGALVYFGMVRTYRVSPEYRLLILFLPVVGFIMVTIKISLLFGYFAFLLHHALRMTADSPRVRTTDMRVPEPL